MSLSRIEQETGINFNEAEDWAIVYTAKVGLIKKLDDLCKRFPKEFKRHMLVGDDEEIKSYHIPKRYIRIGTPRILNDRQKANLKNMTVKRMAKIVKKKPTQVKKTG